MGRSNLVDRADILEEMKLIDGSSTDYITPTGQVYKYYGHDKYYQKKVYQNKYNLYMYVQITFSDGVNRTRRQHVLMAKAYIPNPNQDIFKIVGHKDDVKWHNVLNNLYWTTTQENTQCAVDHGLCSQQTGEQNDKSIYVKALDKNTGHIEGVYGSIRECARCIENVPVSFISKMLMKDNYKPRSRKYIYKKASKEEYDNNLAVQNRHLIENSAVDKSPKIFYLINDSIGYKEKFDNQTQASKICNLQQATISSMIKNQKTINGWRCDYIATTTYSQSSLYTNFVDTQKQYVLEHIKTKEIKIFKTQQEVKDALHFKGHDISEYFYTGHILMNEWKVIAIEDKVQNNINERTS